MIFTFAGAQNYEVSQTEVNSRLENTGKHFFKDFIISFFKQQLGTIGVIQTII